MINIIGKQLGLNKLIINSTGNWFQRDAIAEKHVANDNFDQPDKISLEPHRTMQFN